jgi:hypothetical protein
MDHFNMTSKCYEKGGKKKGKCLCAVCHQVWQRMDGEHHNT